MAKPTNDSGFFLDQLIVQMRIHLQSVGGIYITTGTIAPVPTLIPGFKTWTGYTIPTSDSDVNPNLLNNQTQIGSGVDTSQDDEYSPTLNNKGQNTQLTLPPGSTPTSTNQNTPPNTTGLTEENFYQKFLENIGAPITDENLRFLYAWRQAEGKSGEFNPFNTTQPWPGSTRYNNLGRGIGVRNYKTIEDGMAATIKTIKNGYYDCILNGLINDIGAQNIAKCPSLKTWGTGFLLGEVLRTGGGQPSIVARKPLAGFIKQIA